MPKRVKKQCALGIYCRIFVFKHDGSSVTFSLGYIYNGGSLSQLVISTETTTDESTTTATQALNFAYDASGTPLAVEYNGTTYYYATNLQGDVVAIVSVNGIPVVEYTYDAWGNILSVTGTRADNLGKLNPLRYRGYVYDTETELYYLQSRYYNPEMGRFISADAFVSTGQGILGNNMFAYCLNAPTNSHDANGEYSIVITIPIAIGIINNGINVIYYEFSDGDTDTTPDSYNDEHVSRWERLDYAKQETGEDHYNVNAWRYYSEYTIHELGWYLTGWAYGKNIFPFSNFSESFESADVYPEDWDSRWYVNVATVLWGLLGF